MGIDYHKLSVLVVAESLPLRSLLVSVLQINGVVDVLSATNGQEGFLLFCDHSPGLVLADWDMAAMSGMELALKIRHNPLSPDRRAPVILITALETAMVRLTQARDSGVTGVVLKPFSAADLIKRVSHVVNDPREFIDCPEYFGPDRRRKQARVYAGPLRRAADLMNEDGQPV